MGLMGRGAHYTSTRGIVEGALARLYRGGWPSRAARRAGFQRRVRVVTHDVACAAWPKGAPSLRIAFASDLHAGPTTHPELLELACRTLADARPDVLLLGGDYVFLDARSIGPLARALGRVPAPLGRFAVMGNHDLWADDARIVRALEANGIDVLVNRHVRLAAPFAHVAVCGLDEPWVGCPDATRAIDAADVAVRIVLMHAPAGLLAVGARRFDVAFCGHTHGGHVALPGGVPIVAPGPLSRRYSHGRYAVGADGRATLLVSRGVGGIELPVRTFADPDVVVCTLGAAATTA